MKYITIDSGTTNTRISIVSENKVLDTLKFNVGARAGIKDNTVLKTAIRDGIDEILSKNNLQNSDIERILASGMITSEFGLCDLEHITTPAGISELHNTSKEIVIDEISQIPFVFVRGVKTTSASFENTDMMRGEETELMGIMSANNGECVYVFPGSHSKIIETDSSGRIANFTTMLTGEMAFAISENTILNASISLSNVLLDSEYLIKGYDYCNDVGINAALFKTRVLKNLFSVTDSQVYSFYMGVILCGEVSYIIKLKPKKVVISGQEKLKESMNILLKEKTHSEVVSISKDISDTATAIGMVRIYEYVE